MKDFQEVDPQNFIVRAYAGGRRMWVNQPSTLQPYHRFHGLNVIAFDLGNGNCMVYFTSGDWVGMEMPMLSLSQHWLKPY